MSGSCSAHASSRRSRAAIVGLVLVGLLAAAGAVRPSETHAFSFVPWHWEKRTIKYFNTAKRQTKELRKAVSIWNTSGIRIHFKKVSSAKKADIIVRPQPGGGCGSGYAQVYYGAGGAARDGTVYFAAGGGKRCSETWVTVLAHELGHVIGLGHESRRCAVMNPSNYQGEWIGPRHCRAPAGSWYCRVLSPDDLKGARKIYGGKPKLRKREFCKLPDRGSGPGPDPSPEPAPVTNPAAVKSLKASAVSGIDPGAQLRWELPSKNAPKRLRIFASEPGGACPSRTGAGASQSATMNASGKRYTFTIDSAGDYCFTAVSLKSNGAAGRSVTAKTTLSGRAPDAYFSVDYDYDDGLLLYFLDQSEDFDGQVVAWSWNFGDGTTSTERNPVHRYAATGDFDVTLTVTDDRGNTSTYTTTVYPTAF